MQKATERMQANTQPVYRYCIYNTIYIYGKKYSLAIYRTSYFSGNEKKHESSSYSSPPSFETILGERTKESMNERKRKENGSIEIQQIITKQKKKTKILAYLV